MKEQIAKQVYSEWLACGENMQQNCLAIADNILATIKQAGYLSPEEVQTMLNTLSGGFPEMAEIVGYLRVEEVQLEPLTDEQIYLVIKGKPADKEGRLISQATIAENSKEQLFRRVE